MGKLSLLVTALAVASPCAAQSTVDGDTLKQGGVTYRLWGIDAPEAKQVCPDGWPAGSLATTRLQALTAGRSVVCQQKDRDRYGRVVAICRASARIWASSWFARGSLGRSPVSASTMSTSRKRPAGQPWRACARLRAGVGMESGAAAATIRSP